MSRWKCLSSQNVFQAGFFRLRDDRCQLPDGRIMPHYYVMEFPDWVNVVPITHDGRMVMIRQYRHAADQEFLEIPGGSTHAGQQEDPQLAGARELREETGYQAKEWIYCGHHFPNPAMQNNRVHTYLALDCEKVAAQELDPYEDLVVVEMGVREVVKLLREGRITHSLMAASLQLSLQHLETRNFI